MAKVRSARFNKTFKALGILGAVFALIASAALVFFLVLDIIGYNILVDDGPRQYIVQFESNGRTISTVNYRRGAEIKIPENPTREPDEDDEYNYTYTFKGWDMTGDNVTDILPHYAYYSFLARAVYNRKGVKKPTPPKSSEEETESSSSGSIQEAIMANIRIRHNKFFKALTIFGATLGVVASSTFSVFLGLDLAGVNPFITDNLRSYTATFMSEGSVISETTYRRGEIVQQPDPPSHEMDGESNYLFIGWDLTGNGVLDVLPPRIYYSFTANAVYLKTGKFDLSMLDLQNMDLETLLEILDKLNIDWEQFMDMFDIDPEELLKWLQEQSVLTFNANASKYIAYFRTTSFGDYNYKKKQYNAASFYDSNKISENSINPLCFTADKLKTASSSGLLPDTFDFVGYDITYKTKQDIYPVPDCIYPSADEGRIDSDAHFITAVEDNRYQTEAAYIPAMDDVIKVLKIPSYSNSAIANDEKAYYEYALSNYTTIPKEYEEVVDEMIQKNDWYERDYMQINSIGAYVENLGKCSIFKDGQVNLKYEKNKDPVMGLIENKQGSDLDFNTTALMIFRRLQIPARIVKGYVVPNIQQGQNTITLLNQHYWCEIYVQKVGWMICDCMNAEDFLGTNPYGELDKQKNPIEDDYKLDYIEVKPPIKTDYYVGEQLDLYGMEVEAYYTDGSQSTPQMSEVNVSGYDMSQVGEQTVTVSYTVNGVTKTETFTITVAEDPNKVDHVEFDTKDATRDFYVGDDFEAGDIEATAFYENGNSYDIDPGSLEVDSSAVNMNEPGDYNVVVSYTVGGEEYKTTYTVTVHPEELVDAEITAEPTKTEYYAGEEFDPSGLVVTGTMTKGGTTELSEEDYEILGIDEEDLNTPGTHTATVRTYTNEEHTEYIDTEFEYTVLENNVTDIEVNVPEENLEYTVGDKFNAEDLITQGTTITGNYEHGDPKTFTDYKNVKVEGEPDLSKPGEQTITVSYEIDGETYTTDVTITVAAVDEKALSLSTSVSTAGPGGDMTPYDAFKINTTYVGTMYFRMGAYSTYNSKTASWSDLAINDADLLTYHKAKEVYQTKSVEIEYLMDASAGFAPVYSESNSVDARKVGDKDTYDFTMFDVTYMEKINNADKYVNYARLTDNVEFSEEDQTIYDSYANSITSANSPYLKVNASTDAVTYVKKFCSDNKLTTANTPDKAIKAVKDVKDILQKNYTYDIDFAYGSSSDDPIASFLFEKKGICNNFASASVMIYRNLGIPARYVTGFGVESFGGERVVDTHSAHAWTEVWLANLGWVTVDCTGYDDGHKVDDMKEYYGNGFGGEDTNGIYNMDKEVYSGVFDIEYTMSEDFVEEEGDYQITYCGQSYKNLITYEYKFHEEGVKLPSFLREEIILVEKGKTEKTSNLGKDIGAYTYVPELHIYDRTTEKDVTAEYGFEIGEGKDGKSYTVLPRLIVVSVTPKSTTNFKVGNTYGTSSFNNPTVDKDTPLAEGDTISFTITGTYIRFNDVGTYSDYYYDYEHDKNLFVFHVYHGTGSNKVEVTNNYIIIPDFADVEVKPQL